MFDELPELVRFGPVSGLASTVIIANHGGWPQKVLGNYPHTDWPSFLSESRLDKLADSRTSVIFPQVPRSVYSLGQLPFKDGDRDCLSFKAILARESPAARVFFIGFSLGASHIAAQVARKIHCNGMVIVSGAVPAGDWQMDWRYGKRLNQGKVLVIYGEQERGHRPLGVSSGREPSERIHKLFEPLSLKCEVWEHPGRHEWPGTTGSTQDNWNERIAAYLDL